ncbi:hypothetical protein [Halosimplex halophilum]|uniref:hypothetical protein n=1 Tax=Halosimplex halophilum TaxID=2559572 RepID=UPI00107F1224|nr:hypothetical protein [Halosimplex halophilum]
MQSTTRDALLAAASAAVLLVVLAATGSLSVLTRPGAAATGVVTALAVEALFVADTTVAYLWERPAVQVGSALALVVGGVLAVWTADPWLVAAACWGLATYFVLLALLVAGVWESASA